MSNLEATIQRLADIEEIKQLKHSYCHACDDNYNPETLAPMFTESAIWDGGPMGRVEGRQAIKEFFTGASSMVTFALHGATLPVINVDGDSATGEWALWQPMALTEGDQAMWLVAKYADKYVKVDGKWLFQEVIITVRAFSPYEFGFGRMLMAPIPDAS